MRINFLDLKELNPLSLSNREAGGILTEYIIRRMFDIHLQSSQTVWNRKMFDEEFEREGSGFLICYAEADKKNRVGNAGLGRIGGGDAGGFSGKFTSGDIDPALKPDLQSHIIGFSIFYNVLDEMHILDITVAKEMQSKGMGSLMLDRIIKDNAETGIKYFFLEVRTSNSAAINLYKKFGFKIFMLRKNYYEDNGEDALCMVKEL